MSINSIAENYLPQFCSGGSGNTYFELTKVSESSDEYIKYRSMMMNEDEDDYEDEDEYDYEDEDEYDYEDEDEYDYEDEDEYEDEDQNNMADEVEGEYEDEYEDEDEYEGDEDEYEEECEEEYEEECDDEYEEECEDEYEEESEDEYEEESEDEYEEESEDEDDENFVKTFIAVYRIKNTFLENAYKSKLMTKRQPTERELLHCTAKRNVTSIIQNNFDPQKATRVKYGNGVSFSPNAAYANLQSSAGKKIRAMFFCKVMTEHIGIGTYNCSVHPFDTLRDPNGNVFVKEDESEFYPTHVVFYRSYPVVSIHGQRSLVK